VSVVLAFATPLRALGLWWGLVAGLAAVATLLLLRVRSRLRGALVQVEHAAEGPAAASGA
jgi:Na+-driven multidrug efflux pump